VAKAGRAGGTPAAASGGPKSRVKKRRDSARPPRGQEGPKKRARRGLAQEGPVAARAEAPAAGNGSADGAALPPLRAIEPPAPSLRRTFAEVWRNRAAFLFFLRRFIRKRYGRTYLGYLWLIIPVVFPIVTGTLVFGGILGVTAGGVPYFLFFVVASTAWFTFARTAYFATRSLEISRSDLGRLYVPRLLPLAGSIALTLANLVIYSVIAAGVVVFYVLHSGEFYLTLGPATLLAPLGLALLIVFGLACGLWFSPLAARTRDVRRLAGYALGFWYFFTPVIYPIEQIPSSWRFLASFNPVTAPVEAVKYGLLGVGEVTATGVAVFFGSLLVIGAGGLRLFAVKETQGVERYY
jgi:lipopolysaccharide transport system permease protein